MRPPPTSAKMLHRKSISTIPIPPLGKSAPRRRRGCWRRESCVGTEAGVASARTAPVSLFEGVAVEYTKARVGAAREATLVLVESDVEHCDAHARDGWAVPLREGGTRAARRARSAAWEEEPSSRIAMVPVATPDRLGGTAAVSAQRRGAQQSVKREEGQNTGPFLARTSEAAHNHGEDRTDRTHRMESWPALTRVPRTQPSPLREISMCVARAVRRLAAPTWPCFFFVSCSAAALKPVRGPWAVALWALAQST